MCKSVLPKGIIAACAVSAPMVSQLHAFLPAIPQPQHAVGICDSRSTFCSVLRLNLAAHEVLLLCWRCLVCPQIPFDKVFGKDKAPATFGPFTQTAELINGRAAMLGLAALFFIEGTGGQPFFL
jgi:hypothetical protein